MNFVNIVTKRKKKKRDVHVCIEEELLEVLKTNGFSISGVINIALEKYLREKGLLK